MSFGTLDGTRTRVTDVKGQCPKTARRREHCVSRFVVVDPLESTAGTLNYPSNHNQVELTIEK